MSQFAIAAGLTLWAACLWAQDADPEPANNLKPEPAVASIDLQKAKTDEKLGQQANAHQQSSKRNLAKIVLAVHSFSDTHARLPDDITDKKGKSLLSWRVALLPELGYKDLHKKFKLDESWDSPHNKKLIAQMPDVFRSPRVKLKGKGNTVYQVFTGAEAVFGRGRLLTLATIPDGTSNTLMAVETSEAVPWTKPGGLSFARNKAVPDFGKVYGKKPLAALLDGSVRVLDLNKISEATLKNAIDPSDGNPLGADW